LRFFPNVLFIINKKGKLVFADNINLNEKQSLLLQNTTSRI
jgi:hypothetical protein